jgi:cytochrome oxidase Cu insertion factor (SCO1/SenC/PrrC family)
MPAFLLAVALMSSSLAAGQAKPYPKPQIETASGQRAPDFTLKDQDGNAFTLSSQRGRWILLFFYRGYW